MMGKEYYPLYGDTKWCIASKDGKSEIKLLSKHSFATNYAIYYD